MQTESLKATEAECAEGRTAPLIGYALREKPAR